MTDFSLLLPNIFDDNTRADKERMKRMILRLQNLQSFYYYHSEKSFVSVSFHPLSIHPCFVTKQRWAQFCVKDVKGEKSLENLWPKCPPTKPPTSHFVHVEIQRYHLLEGFETRACPRQKLWVHPKGPVNIFFFYFAWKSCNGLRSTWALLELSLW